jgi:hypothetical protein
MDVTRPIVMHAIRYTNRNACWDLARGAVKSAQKMTAPIPPTVITAGVAGGLNVSMD